jgi:exopolyphosphatase/guanosine-5'-triphosphate,3'-diphosphate pyrophosphatase
MSEAPSAPRAARDGREQGAGTGGKVLYGALDLGTNNCRLLIATPNGRGFRVVDAYSRIVRLGEGLSQTGRLSDAAMDRALAALKVSAEKVRRRGVSRFKAIATQACRSAQNGAEFIERVAAETGLRLEVISPKEEAHLSVAGCVNLLDRRADAALVVDVGGGSTELSWVDLAAARSLGPAARPPIRAWLSIPLGVVTLAEQFPEGAEPPAAWFGRMVDCFRSRLAEFTGAAALRPAFDAGRAHIIGTSGAITSLAGLHLDLPRYDRSRVDGIWMSRTECEASAGRLIAMSMAERAAQPCIGPDRADLVLAGAAILQAVQDLWSCERVRVADRGLREGILLSMMASRPRRRSQGRRRGQGRAA